MLRTTKIRKRLLPETRHWRFDEDSVPDWSRKSDVLIDGRQRRDNFQMQLKWEEFLKDQDNILEDLNDKEREWEIRHGIEDEGQNDDVQPSNPFRSFLAKLDLEALEHPDSVHQRLQHIEQEVHLESASSNLCKWLKANLCDQTGQEEEEKLEQGENVQWYNKAFSKPQDLRKMFEVGGDLFRLAASGAHTSKQS